VHGERGLGRDAGDYPLATPSARIARVLPEGFLYRRLAPFVPCALLNVADGALVLRSKWQVSSLRDVFLSSHYWRIFEHVAEPPKLVVDLGGHCGHFAILCELVLEERFGKSEAQYVIVEGLAQLVTEIHRTLADTGLAARCRVIHGLAGRRGGEGQLRSNEQNLLETSVVTEVGATGGSTVPYVDLLTQLPENQPIDILKIDIEGSEHDLVENYPTLFERARLVAMEVHDVGRPMDRVFHALEAAGLRPQLPHISKGPHTLVLYKRETKA
jgi:FkbM family methyltransferase